MKGNLALEIIEECQRKNETVRRYSTEFGEQSILEWIEAEKSKWEQNRKTVPMQPRDDFVEICREYVAERIDEDAARRVADAVSCGAIHTADHLGGIYSPQSFQGDLFFGVLLGTDCVPCFSAGSVTLHSGTYGRGIQYVSENGFDKLPLFAGKYAKYSASLAPAIAEKDIDRAINRARVVKGVGKHLVEILNSVYKNEKVLNKERFADQVPVAGWKLSEILGHPFDKRPLCYIEAEEVSGRLFLLDIKNEESLAYKLIFDKDILKELNTDDPGSECPLCALLFRGNDGKGHMFPMRLYPDGKLAGVSIYGDELCIDADKETLYNAIKDKKIFVSSYLRAAMLGFARGFSWYGGVFQSLYLPEWQRRTGEALARAGKHELSDEVQKWEESGYISGPIACCSTVQQAKNHRRQDSGVASQLQNDNFSALPTGPVEWFATGPNEEVLKIFLSETKLKAAHALGSFEFYTDLVPPADRMEGWDEELARYIHERLGENCINSFGSV